MNTSRSGYKWTLVALLFFVSALNYGDRTALAAVFPLLRRDLGLTDIDLGLVGAAFLWTYAIGASIAGYIADRSSRSRLIVLSLTGWSVATLLVAFVQNLPQLIGARLLLGITEAFYIPAALALIADYHGAATRGTALSLNLAGMSVGLIGAGTLTGFIAERFGWRPAFVLLGVAGLVLAAVAWWIVRDGAPTVTRKQEPKAGVVESLRILARTPSYCLIVTQAVLTSGGVWMFWNWLPLFYQETFNMSLTGAGFSGTFMLQASACVGIVAGGYFSDRVGAAQPRRRARVMALCYLASAPMLLSFAAPPNYTLISVCIFLFSLIRTFGQANENPMLCDLLPPHLRSTGFGLMLTGNVLAGSVAIFVAGYLKGIRGLGFAFACISGIMLLAAGAAWAAYRFTLERDMAKADERTREAALAAN
ncbi:MAG: MFS transporter [Bryobacteraceae bacterium]